MRTLDELRRDRTSRTWAEREYENAFYSRLGSLSDVMPRYEPTATWSRASQVARTWRTHLAWHLANALGWRQRW